MDKNLYHFIIFFLGLVIYSFYTEKKELKVIIVGQDKVIQDLNTAIDLQQKQIQHLNYYYSNMYSSPSLQIEPVY